jgi:cell division protein FtsB
MAKEKDEDLVMVAALTEPLAIELLLASLPDAMHLRPLWERLVVVDLPECIAIGLPIATKVTKDSVENHRRHLFSLLSLLKVPLVTDARHLHRITVSRDAVRTDIAWPMSKPDKKKAKKAAEAKAEAKAAEEAKAAAEAEAGPEAAAGPEAEAAPEAGVVPDAV